MIALYLITEQSPLKISTALRTQMQLDTVDTYTAKIRNKKAGAKRQYVLQLRILTDIFKIYEI